MTLAPIIVLPGEGIGIKDASRKLGVSDATIRRLNTEYRLGRQAKPGGPIWLSYPGLLMALHGDWGVLERLRLGMRSDPDVSRYFDQLGLRTDIAPAEPMVSQRQLVLPPRRLSLTLIPTIEGSR